MGAWYHLTRAGLRRWEGWPASAAPESASPATGSEKSHKYEQQLLIDQAFGDAPLKK